MDVRELSGLLLAGKVVCVIDDFYEVNLFQARSGGITFEVGGKNKKGGQIRDAADGYLVKDNLEYASGRSVPIWMFGFLY